MKCRNICPILIKFGVPQRIFINVLSIKFHENPSSGSCTVVFGETDLTERKVAFLDCDKACKYRYFARQSLIVSRTNT
jgi:hypothetical protein